MAGKGSAIFKELVTAKLSAIAMAGRLRSLRPLPSQAPGLDLTHNDYLAFRDDTEFQERALAAARDWPMGAGASRLLGGEHAIYERLETAFSRWKSCEASLYFASGYAANETLMAVLALLDADFFSDSLNHASLIDGMRLARIKPDAKHIFRHNDLSDLEGQLRRSKRMAKVVVTESLFSMDGDVAPLAAMAQLCERHEALLVVDEAHALGVYGTAGSGLVSAASIDANSIITINPCGKAMAASGAFISGPEWLRRLLINAGRGFIYSTGASPWIAAGLLASFESIQKADDRRAHLCQLSLTLKDELRPMGYDVGLSTTHIIPLILGSEERSLHIEQELARRQIFARAIRPPTVPEGSCRLRLSLHAGVPSVRPLLKALKEIS